MPELYQHAVVDLLDALLIIRTEVIDCWRRCTWEKGDKLDQTMERDSAKRLVEYMNKARGKDKQWRESLSPEQRKAPASFVLAAAMHIVTFAEDKDIRIEAADLVLHAITIAGHRLRPPSFESFCRRFSFVESPFFRCGGPKMRRSRGHHVQVHGKGTGRQRKDSKDEETQDRTHV